MAKSKSPGKFFAKYELMYETRWRKCGLAVEYKREGRIHRQVQEKIPPIEELPEMRHKLVDFILRG